MTFLLQKFNAINRSRTEARARNGLRPTASGIAFTGRLAVVCLLLAGFLGVGSAIAQQQQPVILRLGGGSATLSLADEGLARGGVHHYVLNGGDGVTPVSHTNFVVGTHAHVVVGTDGNLTVTPLATGTVKLALAPIPGDDLTTGADGTNNGTPILFEIMSSGAPYLTGVTGLAGVYNAGVTVPYVGSMVQLTLKDTPSMKIKDIDDLFDDPDDITITYGVEADPVKKRKDWKTTNINESEEDMVDVAVVSATISVTTLTIALTGNARAMDATKVWLKATDAAGEYARLQIDVLMVDPAANYHVNDDVQKNKVHRTDDVASSIYEDIVDLTTGFTPGGRSGTPHYSVDFQATGGTAVPNKKGASYSIVTPALVMAITQTGNVPGALSTAGASFRITDFRSTGEITLTVRATDVYTCPSGYATETGATPRPPDNITADACDKVMTSVAGIPTVLDDTNQKDSIPDQSKGDSYWFKVSVISATTPKPTATLIAKVTMVADGDSMMVDLADLDSETEGAQPAFSVPKAAGEMTYTVVLSMPIATAEVDSVDTSVIAFAPIWHGNKAPKTAKATVTAENEIGESFDRTIAVEVTHAVTPVVNEKVALALMAGFGLALKTTDRAMTVDLEDLMVPNPLDPTEMVEVGPVFMNPFPDHGSLPGGLLYTMEVEADFKSPESTKNNVITSAMTITLDPGAKPTLTITPYGANSAVVTLTARNRADKSVSASLPVMVVSCDGVDMSGPCDGVATGTENEELPTEVSLSQNYPNPFNPQTTIDYALPKAGDVSLVVYDMLGREVDVLLDGPQAAGRHTVRFGANHLPNGTYVYRLVAADKTITRTMVLVK